MGKKYFLFLICTVLISLNIIHAEQKIEKPRLSIITSIWNGDEFIEGFLDDITKQTMFSECELILINANSPGNEEEVIEKYTDRYPNIIYKKLSYDPGIYAVWNIGIKMAKSDLVCNANIDDRSHYESYEKHVLALEEDKSIDLVYASYQITEHSNETFYDNHYLWVVSPPEFSLKVMCLCIAGPRPVWRKSLHSNYGFFDESFTSSGDLEMWNRAASKGSIFKKIPGYYTLYYNNPKGISTDKDKEKSKNRDNENKRIATKYEKYWK